MIGLLRLLRDHPGAVEADLQRYYRVDLLDLWRRPQRLTYRRCLVLIRHLPADSATATAQRDGAAWTVEHGLLDAIRMNQLALGGVPSSSIAAHPLAPKPVARIAPDMLAALRAVEARAAEDERRHAREEVAHA